MLTAASNFSAVVKKLGLPLIVKPAREGSTIGLSKVMRMQDLEPAFRQAARHDSLVIAEKFISGPEVTVSILDDQALPLIRIEAPGGNYDYHAKYFSDETRYFCPSGIDPALESKVQKLAVDAFRILGCRSWGRVDVIVDEKGKPWLLEVNTVPGLTGHSLVPMAAKAAGLSFDDLVVRILVGASVE
ncbi:MAG: ATP-grasp domain-containing protein, partial [Burkholderiales bacterium]